MNSNKLYPFFPSPNYNDRADGIKISMLIEHYTVTNFISTKNTFLNQNSKVSAHYVIDTDGTIYQFVEENKRAWHAGVAYFNGITDVNSASIGIEIVNPGYDIKTKTSTPYPEVQIASVIKLSKEIIARYNIPKFCVLGHSDVAVTRKIDPGPHFPWQTVANRNVGLFPSKEMIEKQNPKNANVSALLNKYGYDITNLEATKKAFKLHYNPKEWITNKAFNDYDIKTLMALCELK